MDFAGRFGDDGGGMDVVETVRLKVSLPMGLS